MAPLVIFPDAQTVAITHLKTALGAAVGYVASEPPGPDEMDGFLPVLVVSGLRSPPMANRWALSIARLYFEVLAPDQPTANQVANLVNAHVRALAGTSVTVPGGVATVSTVKNCAHPEPGDDTNTDYRQSAFSAELWLRPLHT